MRIKLAWLSNARPDCMFEISQLAQVTDAIFVEHKSECIRTLNRTVRYAVQNPLSVSFPRLDFDSLQVSGFSDSSFANNRDLSSKHGYVTALSDATVNYIPLSFKPYKARRVTRSVMANELIAFRYMFNAAFTMSAELKKMIWKHVPLRILTDIKCLFDVISKSSRTSENRIMIVIATEHEGYNNYSISDIGFVRTTKNLADSLTKTMNQAALQDLLKSSRLIVEPEQWIFRKQIRHSDVF